MDNRRVHTKQEIQRIYTRLATVAGVDHKDVPLFYRERIHVDVGSVPDLGCAYHHSAWVRYGTRRAIVMGQDYCQQALTTEMIEGVIAHELRHAKGRHGTSPWCALSAAWTVAFSLGEASSPELLESKNPVFLPSVMWERALEDIADAGSVKIAGHGGLADMLEHIAQLRGIDLAVKQGDIFDAYRPIAVRAARIRRLAAKLNR